MPPSLHQPSAEHSAQQDVVTLLLDQAMNASSVLDRMRELADCSTSEDPTALASLTDAITILTQVRLRMIHNADRLT